MPISANAQAALPQVRFISGRTLNGGSALPIAIAPGGTQRLPFVGATIDFSGFNTFFFFLTVANLPSGNDLTLVLDAIDPETGVAVADNKGQVSLLEESASGSYAGTLYLPSYYAGLSGLVLPFGAMAMTLDHVDGGGVGNLSITAFKIWLTNV